MHTPQKHSLPLTTALIGLFSVFFASVGQAQTAGETATTDNAAQTCPMAESGQCCAHHGMHGADGKAVPMAQLESMVNELNLSDAQKQEFGTLVQLYRPRLQELAKRGDVSSQEIMTIAPNSPEYNTKAAELSQLAGVTAAEMVTLLTEFQANAFALLSNNQQQSFLQLRAEQQAKMEQRKAEFATKMQERRASGAPQHQHECKACEWLRQDDAAAAE